MAQDKDIEEKGIKSDVKDGESKNLNDQASEKSVSENSESETAMTDKKAEENPASESSSNPELENASNQTSPGDPEEKENDNPE
ncbi:MAG: hypothetical protein P8X57_05770, partial [Cyclobacteriaceae bacterium]